VRFKDRAAAGRALAEKLIPILGKNVVVFGLPRGGVVVGAEVAKVLQAPLGIASVRKIGHPRQPEYAIGAIAEGGIAIYNPAERDALDPRTLQRIEAAELRELERRATAYDTSMCPSPRGAEAVLVDDGIATGLTMRAAIAWARANGAARIVVGVPVSPRETAVAIGREVDAFVSVLIPEPFFGATGAYYDDFGPLGDDAVNRALRAANGP
jgi:predicted phosphoribosyltransferase